MLTNIYIYIYIFGIVVLYNLSQSDHICKSANYNVYNINIIRNIYIYIYIYIYQ